MVQVFSSQYIKILLFIPAVFIILLSSAALSAERYAVSGGVANIRSGPGTTYDVLFKAEKYYPLNIVEKLGNWYQFEDYEGDIGWIHKSLAGKIQSVITIKSKNNIRSGPGTDYRIQFISEQGVPFRVLERKGNWIHVEHSEGHKGWIHKSLVW
ncbi:SH3 domain-containing protein [Thermodesulfobacteriota bacterium]